MKKIKGKRAMIKSIQVGGWHNCHSLRDACEEYLESCEKETSRDKICFIIDTEQGQKQITIRQEEKGMVAYGDFSELPSFIEYSFFLRERGEI